jgi:hypothetical protein
MKSWKTDQRRELFIKRKRRGTKVYRDLRMCDNPLSIRIKLEKKKIAMVLFFIFLPYWDGGKKVSNSADEFLSSCSL